jgi:hypothetical protein
LTFSKIGITNIRQNGVPTLSSVISPPTPARAERRAFVLGPDLLAQGRKDRGEARADPHN